MGAHPSGGSRRAGLPTPKALPTTARAPLTIRDDLTSRAAYSGDASLFRAIPAAIVEPRDAAQVRESLGLARRRGWSVTPRGAGTSVAGNALSHGLILDHSRHHRRILELDADARLARVEPGVVCDELRAAAGEYGLTYGPDPSTHSRCTIGGMVGNNACGSHSVAWGTTAANLRAVRLLLADGRELHAWRGGCSDPAIEAGLRALVAEHAESIRAELGRFPRQVSGYGLHHLLPERGFDVAKSLAGSEGTLGVFTELTVELIPSPGAVVLLALGFEDIFMAAEAAPRLRQEGVLTLEGMGRDLLAALRTRAGRERAGADLPRGDAWLFCDIGAPTQELALALAGQIRDQAAALPGSPSRDARLVTDPATYRAWWRIREDAAGIATRRADGAEAWPGWEDSAVPPTRLAGYLRELYALLAQHEFQGIPYGHFGEGCVHIRIDFELDTTDGRERYRRFLTEAAALVGRHGGSLSGEHGDGRARSELLSTMYSPSMLAAFARFKAIFDPDGFCNPGVLVDPAPFDVGLRPQGPSKALETRLGHRLADDDGSYAKAVRRCVGVGLCRTQTGAMCPSYQVTRDEVASTRGRARVLAEMLRGEELPGWRSREARDALDLCLSCRACATECPVAVDMATLKAEFLHQHYRRRPRPRSHYAMGWLPVLGALAAAVPGAGRALGALTAWRAAERTLLRAAGVETRRAMIPFATLSLVDWWRERAARGEAPPPGAGRRVLLLPDSFTNHHDPLTGIAAVEVLEALGYRVALPTARVCCGLTWHSTGQLGVAARVLSRTLGALEPYVEDGWTVVGLEPSCTGHLRRAGELVDDPRTPALAQATRTFAEVIADTPRPWPFDVASTSGPVLLQTHCHDKGLPAGSADAGVLRECGVPTVHVQGGCCGLAGNWGYEPGHHDVSMACAERELFPAIRAHGDADAVVCADGFSCRTQVGQGTSARAHHLAVLLRRALQPEPGASEAQGRG